MLLNQSEDLTPDMASAEAVALFLESRHRSSERQEQTREVAARRLAKVGLFCLSEVRDSILMWSHYAQDHFGYCLEFAAEDHEYMFGAAQPVSYCDDYPVVEFYNTPIDRQVQLIFLTKYRGWAYEREWRVIDTKGGSGLHSYPPILLTGVIFGLRMPESQRKHIRSWVKNRGHAVRFYECTQDDRRFAIEIRRIE